MRVYVWVRLRIVRTVSPFICVAPATSSEARTRRSFSGDINTFYRTTQWQCQRNLATHTHTHILLTVYSSQLKKTRLSELVPTARGSQHAGSRNLIFTF